MVKLTVNKKILVALIFLTAFIYAAFTYIDIASKVNSSECNIGNYCPHEEQLNFINGAIPFIVSVSVVVGAGVYYFMSQKVESKEISLKKQSDVLLKFLNTDERKLVNLLIDNKGKALQAEASRLPGMSKLKSHRVVQKLVDKGVIESEKVGKTNIVKFTKEIREGLL